MQLPSISDLKSIAGDVRRKTEEYDTRATVTRVTDSAAYVKFEGSDIETPIEDACAGVKPGDVVSVHVSHGDTHIVGNRTDPAASSEAFEIVRARFSIVDSFFEVINSRVSIRDNAMRFLDNNGEVIASFGKKTIIGRENGTHVSFDGSMLEVGDGYIPSGDIELMVDHPLIRLSSEYGFQYLVNGRETASIAAGIASFWSVTANYLTVGGSRMSDFVTESGTDSNGWQYRKWSSGRLEAWKTLDLGTLSFTSATGGGYASVANVQLPSGLLYQPWVQLTASQSGASYFVSAAASYVTKSTFQANVARHFGSSSAHVILSAYVVGTWK